MRYGHVHGEIARVHILQVNPHLLILITTGEVYGICYTGRKEASIESESVCNLAKHGSTKRAACRAVIELVRLGSKIRSRS